MNRQLLLSFTLLSFSAFLASCGKDEHSALDVGLLSTDVHLSVAQQSLVLPFVALDDYAYRKQSFSLKGKSENKSSQNTLKQFMLETANPKEPLVVETIAVLVRTFGWNDADMSQRRTCPLLTRAWAQSVCDNPWAATQQALPANQFKLLNLRGLQIGSSPSLANCRTDSAPIRALPQISKKALIVCAAQVFGGKDDEFHTAIIRIEGDLGALWMVWRYGQNGETAEAMAEREGNAIVAFVQHGLGGSENFPKLNAEMCRLRRPGSGDGVSGAGCR